MVVLAAAFAVVVCPWDGDLLPVVLVVVVAAVVLA